MNSVVAAFRARAALANDTVHIRLDLLPIGQRWSVNGGSNQSRVIVINSAES